MAFNILLIVVTTYKLLYYDIITNSLLTRHPELSKMFKKFMTLRDDGKYDWDLDGLQRHANLVMQALEAAIDNLDDSRVLSLILNDLGRKHARYQVQEDMFDVR